MMKLITIKILIVAMILFSTATDSMAQTRIRFKRGKSSATLNGRLAPDAVREYVIQVGRGQDMTVEIQTGSDNFGFQITGKDGHIAWGDNGYANIETNYKGDHYIAVKNLGGKTANFIMKVTVR